VLQGLSPGWKLKPAAMAGESTKAAPFESGERHRRQRPLLGRSRAVTPERAAILEEVPVHGQWRKEDISWGHMDAVLGNLTAAVARLDGQVDKLGKYIVFGMTLAGFVPILTVFAESIACWRWHRPEGFYLPTACRMEDDGYDGSAVPYWCMCFFLSVLGFSFIWAQAPYIFSGGDITLLRKEDMCRPGKWMKALEAKQHQRNMGSFRKETGFALCAATISEMIMKIVIPIAPKMVPLDARRPCKIAGALICFMAIMQRCVVREMRFVYKKDTANLFESGCKAILIVVTFSW